MHSIARVVGKKAKDVAAKLGPPQNLASVADTRMRIAGDISPRLKSYMQQARGEARKELAPLEVQRQSMAAKHQAERQMLDAGQRAREEQEVRERNERLRQGLAGLWDRLRGEYTQRRKQNEMEALFALQRDREQRHALVQSQLRERAALQRHIRETRARHAERLRTLHKDAANYRLMQRGEAPNLKQDFEQTKTGKSPERPGAELRPPQTLTQAFNQAAQQPKPSINLPQRPSSQDRLQRLREGRKRDPKSRDRGHEPDLER